MSALLHLLAEHGVKLEAWALAWARVLPTMLLVPAFGARVLPAQARIVLGLALAVTLVPALAQRPPRFEGAFVFAFATEALAGLPVALSTAALLWAVMMAGGVIDDLRGSSDAASSVFTDAPTPIGTLLGLFVASAFIELGGAARVLLVLARPDSVASNVWLGAATDIVRSIEIALALAAPVLCAVVVFEVAGALIARAASPAHVRPMIDPLRALLILAVLAVTLNGMLELASRHLVS